MSSTRSAVPLVAPQASVRGIAVRCLFAFTLALCLAPTPAHAQQRGRPIDAIVRALIPVLGSVVDSIRASDVRRIPAWRVEATEVPEPVRHRLRDAILANAQGRAVTPADTVAHYLEVASVQLRGDSAIVGVDHGFRWCEHGWLAESGTTYEYFFRWVAGEWRYAGRRPYIAYDPPPPPPPGEKKPVCNLVVAH